MALVGTERHPGPLPTWPGEIGALMAATAASAEHPGRGLLRAAAVLAACGLAGSLGEADAGVPPPAAPPDSHPSVPDGPGIEHIAWALRDGPARLQQDVLATLAGQGWCLPPDLLPAALELSRRSLALRPLVAPVLGERGRWLASQRDDWRHAAGVAESDDAEDAWALGSLDQRRTMLEGQRQQEPDVARERLAGVLPELPARERADLAAVLAVGLAPADEALLDTLRQDRSREVRQVALNLLLRLPGAGHPQRAAARLARQLNQERALLGQRWVIEAPEATGDDWSDDQIEIDRPKQEALGERAWWLFQLVRQVPLGWWTGHTGMTPAELLAWAAESDWAEALQRGWHAVLLAAPDASWAGALLGAWPDSLKRHDPSSVLALLEPAARERRWLQQLRDGGIESLDTLLPQVLAGSPAPQALSPELSGVLLDAVAQRLQAGRALPDGILRTHLPELACAVHRSALPRLHALPRSADEPPALAELMRVVVQVAATRSTLDALHARSSTSPAG